MRLPSSELHGVLLIDKPRGITSFDVVAEVRRRTGVRRVGHTGTLDPMASGLLPVCLGEATKLVPFLTDGDKRYQAVARLGELTDSGDAEGNPIAKTEASHIAEAAVRRVMAQMVGLIDQIPPMHSAIRVHGRRLYELAREGQEIERKPRRIQVFSLTLDEMSGQDVRFSVHCSKGTYIRSLAVGLGEALLVGAHLIELRRTGAGPFAVSDAVPLAELASPWPLMSLADALCDFTTVKINDTEAQAVRDGKVDAVAGLAPPGLPVAAKVRLLLQSGELLAVAEMQDQLRLKRVFI